MSIISETWARAKFYYEEEYPSDELTGNPSKKIVWINGNPIEFLYCKRRTNNDSEEAGIYVADLSEMFHSVMNVASQDINLPKIGRAHV